MIPRIIWHFTNQVQSGYFANIYVIGCLVTVDSHLSLSLILLFSEKLKKLPLYLSYRKISQHNSLAASGSGQWTSLSFSSFFCHKSVKACSSFICWNHILKFSIFVIFAYLLKEICIYYQADKSYFIFFWEKNIQTFKIHGICRQWSCLSQPWHATV